MCQVLLLSKRSVFPILLNRWWLIAPNSFDTVERIRQTRLANSDFPDSAWEIGQILSPESDFANAVCKIRSWQFRAPLAHHIRLPRRIQKVQFGRIVDHHTENPKGSCNCWIWTCLRAQADLRLGLRRRASPPCTCMKRTVLLAKPCVGMRDQQSLPWRRRSKKVTCAKSIGRAYRVQYAFWPPERRASRSVSAVGISPNKTAEISFRRSFGRSGLFVLRPFFSRMFGDW